MTFKPMKPATILRRASEAERERLRRRRALVVRLTETVARYQANGDLISAALFAELLVEAQERLDEMCAPSIVVGDPEQRT